MNGVKLEHMCHYIVNLWLYCDCLFLFSAQSQAGSFSKTPPPHGLQTSNIAVFKNSRFFSLKRLLLIMREWLPQNYFKELHKLNYLPPTTNGGSNFPRICRVLGKCGDLAELRRSDTRRKANSVGIPDCDTEICFSLDQLVSARHTATASESRL